MLMVFFPKRLRDGRDRRRRQGRSSIRWVIRLMRGQTKARLVALGLRLLRNIALTLPLALRRVKCVSAVLRLRQRRRRCVLVVAVIWLLRRRRL